ncbi:MAG TPA: hypothetical protein VNW92_05515 [Polyangiaceae bacterium]|nr:hypothetical protein [Polyangiaceae bacterium]
MRSLPSCFGWLSLLVALGSLPACGSSHDDIAKRLAAMQGDLTRLQNHSDRLEERLEALEMRKEAAAARPTAEAAPTLDHPKLMVVKLEPGDDSRDAPTDSPTAELRPEDSAADKSPRPVIRVHGAQSDGDVKMASDADPTDGTPRRKGRGQ